MAQKESRSEFTASGALSLAPIRSDAYERLANNGWKVGHNFCRPAAAAMARTAKNKFAKRS